MVGVFFANAKGANTMRHKRPNSNAVLETRVDYVESRLGDAITSLKEAIQQSEARLAADRQAFGFIIN